MSYALRINRDVEFQVLECGQCGVEFAMPTRKVDELRETKDSFYCPNGHCRAFKTSEAERLRRELETAKREAEWERQRVTSLEKRLTAQKGQMTKLKKRVSHGVCPCCKRTFKQLSAHMAQVHPDYAKGGDEAQDAANSTA